MITKAVLEKRNGMVWILCLKRHIVVNLFNLFLLIYLKQFFLTKVNKAGWKKMGKQNHSNAKILNNITDIFSVNLLWNIINKADINITKIEIIEQFINYCFSNYSKIAVLPLLEPKNSYEFHWDDKRWRYKRNSKWINGCVF